MPVDRPSIVAAIIEERERQFNLPGSEWDMKNAPNDYVAIASHYLGETVRRGGNLPLDEEFRDSLIKAAAVIVAALEQTDRMVASGHILRAPPASPIDN
jgi:hypothetical protein